MKPIPRVSGFRIASPLLSGVVWSIIWLAAGTLLLSLLLYGTAISEQEVVPWVFGIHGFASLCGGFVSARKSGRKGWSVGMTTGLFYAVAVLLTSFLANDVDWTVRIPMLIVLAALFGAIGGMFGVNTGASRRPMR
ncbi:TIGR04086 family membrane protein [Cohnella lubricantis]|uniref:TIGR04086 family membrane protein n=1 Tax=Cohnella lubricantis TaxID=2163172 RepID=A0A841TGR2_9BACL|nr:TIGR04086 family membrane protein [Cohnella lubricantis]MBB6677641.1 TIGR04086 family membrane protein [Cohnella lubricantis]MBP2116471.1 putative membrane protein (TIGR04086 family) [Cohnella lubricantis]